MSTTTETEVSATFPSAEAAEAAVQALVTAGVPRDSIQLTRTSGDEASRYIWRLVVIIVLWSILGGVWGALIGLGLYATIGPEGTAGLVLEVVSWTIMGHLIVGMVAGYWVLADRTEREMPPDREAWLLTVWCSEEQAELVRGVLK